MGPSPHCCGKSGRDGIDSDHGMQMVTNPSCCYPASNNSANQEDRQPLLCHDWVPDSVWESPPGLWTPEGREGRRNYEQEHLRSDRAGFGLCMLCMQSLSPTVEKEDAFLP